MDKEFESLTSIQKELDEFQFEIDAGKQRRHKKIFRSLMLAAVFSSIFTFFATPYIRDALGLGKTVYLDVLTTHPTDYLSDAVVKVKQADDGRLFIVKVSVEPFIK